MKASSTLLDSDDEDKKPKREKKSVKFDKKDIYQLSDDEDGVFNEDGLKIHDDGVARRKVFKPTVVETIDLSDGRNEKEKMA